MSISFVTRVDDGYGMKNSSELQSLAAKAVGSDRCISMTKLAEGGYNRVFRLTMNDKKKVLARIPNPNAGPAFKFDRFRSRYYGAYWGATSDNAVGSKYIIMEEASGSQLELVWDQPSPDKKLSIMREIVTIESKMLAVSFSHFGSIYFASDAVESAVPAFLTSEASSELKNQVNKKFSIGPTVDRGFWNKERSSMQISQGPSIIDWQGSWAGPLFLQSQPSPLVDYQGGILLQRPDNFDALGPEQQADIKQKIFKPTLYQLYLLETKERNPLLAKAFHLAHGKTRRLPMEFAGNTWDDDIVPFREALINVERHWQELGIGGQCPYHFTQDELNSHSIDSEGWNEVEDFFQSIDGLVKRDGWTHQDTFEAAFNFFSELREQGLKHMRGEEQRALDRQTDWARKKS
ncbi:hypothetical protein MYU51_006597 [Penicillium brevicompactum]